MVTKTRGRDPASAKCLSVLKVLLAGYHSRGFSVRLWDGTVWEADPGDATKFTIVLKHPDALCRMVAPPRDLALAEAYVRDDFDIEGDIEAALALGEHLCALPWTTKALWGLFWQLGPLVFLRLRHTRDNAPALRGKLHSQNRDRRAVPPHYDLSNDFFTLWLDRRMVYSCAYFSNQSDDLDRAQERKLDYLCRKLRLMQGERLLDIGCGWGGLIMHAARHYGVDALGLTLSKPQAELANEQIRQRGLDRSCRVELCDYRDLSISSAFDKILSVGMYEHVGASALPKYFDQVWRLLRPGGVFLNHGIAIRNTFRPDRFIDRYVFPDGELIPIGPLLTMAEQSGFEVRDVESLREHYAMTLRHWLRRLEAGHAEATQIVDETTYRVFRLYLSAFAARFQSGLFDLYQTLLLKSNGGESGLPLTRDDWYMRTPPEQESWASV
ncbi:MAG: class I SAM-dependent methyltransferase [Nitrospira defluvii]|nr:class I SAM-dependent methyltransferase [Nitrospira defluvii]